MKSHVTFKPLSQYRNTSGGYTLLELIVVVAIMGSMFAVSAVLSVDSVTRSHIVTERDQFVSLLLNSARSHAMANKHQTSHGVHLDNSTHTYVLFSGTAYDPNNPENRSVPFTNEHISVSHSEGSESILFEALSGDVLLGAGTITFEGNGILQHVTLNEAGQINW